MKRVVALDTSTWWGGVALAEGDPDGGNPAVVAEIGVHVEDSHAVHLLSWIDRLLDLAAWSRSTLDGFVATRGPGSFTGVRIGLGTVRGLALATGRPSIGVGTLQAIAEANGPAERDRVALLDAGRGEWFAARYDAASLPPAIVREPWLARVADVLETSRGALLIPGPDDRVAIRLAEESDPELRVAASARGVAAAAARLALRRLDRPDEERTTMTPLYLRASDAELKTRRG